MLVLCEILSFTPTLFSENYYGLLNSCDDMIYNLLGFSSSLYQIGDSYFDVKGNTCLKYDIWFLDCPNLNLVPTFDNDSRDEPKIMDTIDEFD